MNYLSDTTTLSECGNIALRIIPMTDYEEGTLLLHYSRMYLKAVLEIAIDQGSRSNSFVEKLIEDKDIFLQFLDSEQDRVILRLFEADNVRTLIAVKTIVAKKTSSYSKQ